MHLPESELYKTALVRAARWAFVTPRPLRAVCEVRAKSFRITLHVDPVDPLDLVVYILFIFAVHFRQKYIIIFAAENAVPLISRFYPPSSQVVPHIDSSARASPSRKIADDNRPIRILRNPTEHPHDQPCFYTVKHENYDPPP